MVPFLRTRMLLPLMSDPRLKRRLLMLLKRTLRSMTSWPELTLGTIRRTRPRMRLWRRRRLATKWRWMPRSLTLRLATWRLLGRCLIWQRLSMARLVNSNFKQAVKDLTDCLAKRIKALPSDSRLIAETHYQLGVAQAHCAEYAKAEKSLEAAVAVLNTRIDNLKKMSASDNNSKELAELTLLCTEIKERSADHKEMQKGTYKEDKDFVSIWSMEGAEVHEISTKKAVASA